MAKLEVGKKAKIISEKGKKHGLKEGLEVVIAYLTSTKSLSIVRTPSKAAIVSTSDLEVL